MLRLAIRKAVPVLAIGLAVAALALGGVTAAHHLVHHVIAGCIYFHAAGCL